MLAPPAHAHFERPVSFPNPAPDRLASPPAGGKVPSPGGGERTLIVCQPGSIARARRLASPKPVLRRNRRLRARCRFRNVQAAVDRARSGDRILVLPGIYREEPSRGQPTFDPRCDRLRVRSEDQPGGETPQALTFAYQARCRNDQNLVAVIGRSARSGRCVRCNLRIEGTGAGPGAVVVDAAPRRGLQGKDVGLRVDRADGFSARNLSVRGAGEYGFYVIETDGFAVRNTTASRNGLYGYLTFVSDHGLVSDCEAYLNGDAGIYPGASPESAPRLNQRFTRCDVHHNTLGVSGTMGNAVLFDHNRFHDNAVGVNFDSFLAANHPGYPQDSVTLRDNRIYSNNFNPYLPGSPIEATFPYPVGTGIYIAGGNRNLIEGNRIYDNWRRGSMLISVPGPAGRPPPTSHANRHRNNVMGVAPGGRGKPNGVDFWWDESGRGNCWEDNGGVASDPRRLDSCPGGVGPGDANKNAELAACGYSPRRNADCPWFTTPPRPGGSRRSSSPARLMTCPSLSRLRCGASPFPARRSGSVNARQTCRAWNAASEASRQSVVRGLRAALAADHQFRGVAVVPERQARDQIDLTCGQPLASGFTLFGIFTRTATVHAGDGSLGH